MFRQIPVLPVVLPLAAAIFVTLLWLLIRRGRLTAARASVAAAVCVYAAGVAANTVFPIFLDKPPGTSPWTASLALVPFAHYEIADAAMNIVIFAPVGVLVPLFMVRPAWWRVMLVVTVASLVIETTQYLTAELLGGGHIADVNDLLSNVAGGALGYGLLRLACTVPSLDSFLDRFKWWHIADAGGITEHPGLLHESVTSDLWCRLAPLEGC